MGDYPLSNPGGGIPTSTPSSMYASYQPDPGATETTQELAVSDDMRQLAALDDIESTVDIDHAVPSQLPPFLGLPGSPTKKA